MRWITLDRSNGLPGYRCLGDDGTDRREILHDRSLHIRPGQVFSLLGAVPHGIPQIRNFGPKFWPFGREDLDYGKSQRYMSIRA